MKWKYHCCNCGDVFCDQCLADFELAKVVVPPQTVSRFGLSHCSSVHQFTVQGLCCLYFQKDHPLRLCLLGPVHEFQGQRSSVGSCKVLLQIRYNEDQPSASSPLTKRGGSGLVSFAKETQNKVGTVMCFLSRLPRGGQNGSGNDSVSLTQLS